MRIGDVLAGQPAGGGAAPAGGDAVGLGYQPSLRVEQVQEDVIGGGSRGLRPPDQGDGEGSSGFQVAGFGLQDGPQKGGDVAQAGVYFYIHWWGGKGVGWSGDGEARG